MSYRLFVRPVEPFADLEQNPESQLFSWLLQDASGDTQASGAADSRESIEQTLGQNALEKVLLIGLIPGDEALFCLADIPAKQSRFVQQALPYAVEEQIAQDIDTVHLALGRHSDDGYHVAAIDHGSIGQWLELFSGWEHVRLDAIYPDASLLPSTENGWTACLDGEWTMLGSHRGEWLRLQTVNLGMLGVSLAAPLSEEVIAEIPVTVYGSETDLEQWQPTLMELVGSDGRVRLEQKNLEFSTLELLAWSHHHHLCQPINLCQGAYSVKADGNSPLKPWKPLIAVASVWFVIQLGLQVGMGVYQNQEAEKLRDQAMAIYREAFPGDGRTHAGNVRRVIEGQLRVAGSGREEIDFVALMKYTGDQYSRISNPQAVTFNSINYSRSRGELVVDIRADTYERMSSLRNGIANQGLQAQIGSVVNESTGSRGRLTVSGG